MNSIVTTYIELPAPLAVVYTALQETIIWLALPIDAECSGNLWLWQNELYAIEVEAPSSACVPHTDPPPAATLQFKIISLAWGKADVCIDIHLYDAVIATHALIQVQVRRPTFVWPWQAYRLRQRLRDVTSACCNQLQALLHNMAWLTEQTGVSLALESMPQSLSITTGIGITQNNHQVRQYDESLRNQPVSPMPMLQHRHASGLDTLRMQYPQTVACFEAIGALDHLERIQRLEQSWQQIMDGAYDDQIHQVVSDMPVGDATDYDLIYAGGGLGLLHAAVMARRYGLRVMLFDRGDVGCVHREWNISRDELQALVDIGLVTWTELADVIMREYRNGVVRFYDSPASQVAYHELWLPDVLNLALDANALLRLVRHKFEQAGGTILDRHVFQQMRVCEHGGLRVEVELVSLHTPARSEIYSARLLLDGMGTTSPLALKRHAGQPFASICPTVGTVAAGFAPGSAPEQFDPTIGDILVSVADMQHGRQLIWEGFPGRNDELTVYLFYYATLKNQQRKRELHRPYSLLELFEHYFTLLPSYKQPGADFRHIKPVYGYIPGRHSLRPQEVPLLRGVLPIGDSAAQQSPLTFCGFGSHVRNLHRTTSLLDYALRHNLLEPHQLGQITAFQTNVSLNWVFSRFMHPWSHPHNVNEIQNVFLRTLNHLGPHLATRFFQDRMRWNDYLRITGHVLRIYPDILTLAWQVLGPQGLSRCVRDQARFTLLALCSAGGHIAGPQAERVVCQLADTISPTLGLRVRAQYAEWHVMGWL